MTLLEFLPRDLHHAGPPNESHAGLYEDTTDRGPGMRGGLVSSVIVAAIIVAFRLHARLIVVKSMGVDDYLILGAMVISLAAMSIALEGTNNGWGIHGPEIHSELHHQARLYSYLIQLLFVPTTALTKFSILYSYLRFSPNLNFRNRIFFLFIWTFLWCVSTFLALLFRCTPVNAFWIFNIAGARCVDSQRLVLVSCALNSITDLAVAFLPAPMLWRARLPMRERGGLVILFSFAGIVVVVGVARWCIYLDTINKGLSDCAWQGSLAVVLGIVEANTGIIGASIPALRPLWNRYASFKRQSELIDDIECSTESRKGTRGAISPARSDIECAGMDGGAFSYAATTPSDRISTLQDEAALPTQGVAPAKAFKSLESELKRASLRLSVTTRRSSYVGNAEDEARRVPTSRTWLSLDDEDSNEEHIHKDRPLRLSEVTTAHSLDEDQTGLDQNRKKAPEQRKEEEEVDTRRRSLVRSPTPPLPAGIEMGEGAFSYAATTPPSLNEKPSKASLKATEANTSDSNASPVTSPSSAASSAHHVEKKRDIKRWIPEIALPFITASRSRSRGRTVGSTDTFELGRARER